MAIDSFRFIHPKEQLCNVPIFMTPLEMDLKTHFTPGKPSETRKMEIEQMKQVSGGDRDLDSLALSPPSRSRR